MDDKAAIEALMYQYCIAIDRADFKAFARLFAHAVWLVEGVEPGPESAGNVILYEDGTPRTKHIVSNVTIEVDATADCARGHSYVTVYQQVSERPLQVIFAGEYFDEFERQEGAWRFKSRDIRHPLIGDLRGHLKLPSATFPTVGGNA
jgi:3-phenylpropionate/cinnamic acid dioxygenase small subunit